MIVPCGDFNAEIAEIAEQPNMRAPPPRPVCL
jgi:hypothetical protein